MPTQPRVLMVEDHPDIADLYQLKLQLEGYRVAVASNGMTGLKLARDLKPDVILLDVHVPVLDGLQLLAALRADEETRDVLVVICSEDDNPQLIREAERLQAAAYLVKGRLLPSGLSQKIGEVLRHRGPVALAAALVVVGGVAGGALGAEVILGRTPAPVAATSPASSASAAPAQTPISAAALYKQAVAGIVTITTEVARRGQVGEGTGSGIVLDRSGDILTNAHVVSGANQIQVTFNDGRTATATLASANSKADLAVIRVSVSGASLHPLPLGNSDTVRVGDAVYAIGAPFGLAGSMTAGIVSGLNRTDQASGLSGLIQTDAPINPGNSGGALLNRQGLVVGVNDSIESPVAGNVGVGFAIPINVVKQLLASLEGGANQ